MLGSGMHHVRKNASKKTETPRAPRQLLVGRIPSDRVAHRTAASLDHQDTRAMSLVNSPPSKMVEIASAGGEDTGSR